MLDPSEITALVNRRLELGHLPTVDELNARITALADRHPRLCRLRSIGTSRQGEPLRMLTIGTGLRHAVVVGGPHPNEPVGFVTLLQLARLLIDHARLRERSGYTWHIIPCIDPDGARLNEAWYTGPLTLRRYHEYFYRPALRHQPEWTFPVDAPDVGPATTLPETAALARVINELTPRLLCSLHNADIGGAFFITSSLVPGLAEALADAAARHQIPLDLSPIDTSGWPEGDPGVFVIPRAEAATSGAATSEAGDPWRLHRHGASSTHYAGRLGTFSLIPEVPLWADSRCADASPTDQPRTDVLRTAAKRLREPIGRLAETLAYVRSEQLTTTPFTDAVEDTLTIAGGLADTWTKQPHDAGFLTVSEVVGLQTSRTRLCLRAGAMLIRLVTEELRAGNRLPRLSDELAMLHDYLFTWRAQIEAAIPTTPVPLARLVRLQLSATLTTAAYLDL